MCRRVASCGNFTCDSLQYYLFVCIVMKHHMHNVAPLGDLPGKDEIFTFFNQKCH